jgi:hypothetical protein
MNNNDIALLKLYANAVLDESVPPEIQGIRLSNFRNLASPKVILDLIDSAESRAAMSEQATTPGVYRISADGSMDLLCEVCGNSRADEHRCFCGGPDTVKYKSAAELAMTAQATLTAKEQFLAQLAESVEIVKDWPNWKRTISAPAQAQPVVDAMPVEAKPAAWKVLDAAGLDPLCTVYSAKAARFYTDKGYTAVELFERRPAQPSPAQGDALSQQTALLMQDAAHHLERAHRFVEATEALGHGAESGILQAGNDKATAWNVDASKATVVAIRALAANPSE